MNVRLLTIGPRKMSRPTEHADSKEDARNVTVEQVKVLDKLNIQNIFDPLL